MKIHTLLVRASGLATAAAFYIPGWSIRSYAPDEPIQLLVNKVYSDRTQLQFPYAELPFTCSHAAAIQKHQHDAPKSPLSALAGQEALSLSLGEILRGDRITASDMEIAMGHNTSCRVLCDAVVPMPDVLRARELVKMGYVVEWIIDNLPGATRLDAPPGSDERQYAAGFKLGSADLATKSGVPRFFLHNHHTIVLLVRPAPQNPLEKVIVGFEVHPQSIGPGEKRDEDGCPANLDVADGFELSLPLQNVVMAPGFSLDKMAPLTIPYTYSVHFRDDDSIEWSSRWDRYFGHQKNSTLRVHWLAIFNSLAICAALTGTVAVILSKTIGDSSSLSTEPKPRRSSGTTTTGLLDDYYSGDDDSLDLDSSITGWKRLHADVFRPPPASALLAPLVGSGTQLLFMSVSLVGLAAAGVLNPSWRGGFITVGVGLFVATGLVAGYFSGRISRSTSSPTSPLPSPSLSPLPSASRASPLLTAALFPGLLLCVGLLLNLFAWANSSSTAIPITTLVAMLLLWLGVQLPLVYLGSWYGFSRVGAYSHPTRVAPMPRPVPLPRPWYIFGPFRTMLVAGVVPFAIVLVELLFVLQSLWRDKSAYYYVPGFLAIVAAVCLVSVAEVSIVATHILLCAEDHAWWWRSFAVGASSSVWVFGYCVWYFAFRLDVEGWASGVLFFGYCALGCAAYALLTGTVGFLASYAFVRRIYRSIKVD